LIRTSYFGLGQYLFELSDYYNEHRDEYYAALRSADRPGDYAKWITFFLGGFSYPMVRTQELVRNRGGLSSRAAGFFTSLRPLC